MPHTIAKVIHQYKVAMKIFPTNKGAPKPHKRNKKVHGREQAPKDSKGGGANAKKEKKAYLVSFPTRTWNATRRRTDATNVGNKASCLMLVLNVSHLLRLRK